MASRDQRQGMLSANRREEADAEMEVDLEMASDATPLTSERQRRRDGDGRRALNEDDTLRHQEEEEEEEEMDADTAVMVNSANRERPQFSLAREREMRRLQSTGALFGIGFLFLVIVYLVVHRSLSATHSAASATSSDTTKEDVMAAVWHELPRDVQRMMNREVHPCDDFYQFSCGSWLAEVEIPADRTAMYASFSTVAIENERVLQEIMHENLPYIGELYSTCMNTTAIDLEGAAPLQDALQRIAHVDDAAALLRLAGELSKRGPNFFTALGVEPNATDATVYTLFATQTGLSLPDPEYYLDASQWDPLVTPYQEYIATMFELAGWTISAAAHDDDTGTADNHTATATANAEVVTRFEMELAKLYTAKEELQDPVVSYNPMSIPDAMAKYPLLLGEFITGTGLLTPTSEATGDGSGDAANRIPPTVISVSSPKFFERVEKLIADTPLATLRVVLAYQYIRDWAPNLSEPFLDASFSFFSARIGGQRKRSPRWRLCLHRVVAQFPDLMGKYYFIKHFDHDSEALAQDMVNRIEAAMEQALAQSAWLDDATKRAAADKLARIANLIGHAMQSQPLPFVLSMHSYADNLATLADYQFERSIARIGRGVDRSQWLMSPSAVNAYYDPSTNQIVFPAGILQPPFFDKSRHAAQNYGAIGSIIGHEITHGFDDQGRYFDGNGNLVDWWNRDTDAAFRERATCLTEQYSAFPVVSAFDGTTLLGHVNGNFTLGENIADNGGVKVAFAALEAHLKHPEGQPGATDSEQEEAHNEEDNDGGNTAPTRAPLSMDAARKLFFVSFAQAFCAKSTDESVVNRLSTDPHSPEQWRVNGALMNNAEFARLFECSKNSPMRPTHTCEVW